MFENKMEQSTSFLDSCYREEQALYDQLITLQQVIRHRGGQPKVSASIDNSFTITALSSVNAPKKSEYGNTHYKNWNERTIAALKHFEGRATPRAIIKWIEETQKDLEKVAPNVYNALSKLYKVEGRIMKHEGSSSSDTMYILK